MTSPNPTVTKDEAEDGNKGCQPISEEAVNESSREAAAATALTTLLEEEDDQEAAEGKGGSRSVHEGEDEHDNDGGERNAVFYEEGDEGKDFRIPLRLTKSGRKRATSFPIKLMKVLSAEQNAEIIAWTPSGKAFMILQPKLFCAQILSEEFKSAKFSSFTRKLHRWGFIRHYRGQDAGAFYHKHFQKGRIDLVEKMSCYKPISGSTSKNPFSESRSAPKAPVPTAGSAGGDSQIEAATENASSSHEETVSQANLGAANPNKSVAGYVQASHKGQTGMSQHPQHQQRGGLQVPFMMDGHHDLDTAIEIEVARRLKERLNAAGLPQQPLLMMPPQQIPHGGFDTRSLLFPPQANFPVAPSSNVPSMGTIPGMPAGFTSFQPQGAHFGAAGTASLKQPVLTGGFLPYEAMQQFGILSNPNIQTMRADGNSKNTNDNSRNNGLARDMGALNQGGGSLV